MSVKKNLPTSLELLWSDVEQPSRGPKPQLTIALIVRTAIDIADAQGLAALSMQRIARELGYTTMSLYRYIPSKENLITLMVDRASTSPPAPEHTSWRTEIETWVMGVWAIYRSHPWILQVQISGPPLGPNQLAWFEAALRPLTRSGLDAAESISAATFLLSAVRELARISRDLRTAREEAGISATQVEADFATALQRYVTAEHFPTLAKLVSENVFKPVDNSNAGSVDPNLHFGIQRLLDGIETHAQGRKKDLKRKN